MGKTSWWQTDLRRNANDICKYFSIKNHCNMFDVYRRKIIIQVLNIPQQIHWLQFNKKFDMKPIFIEKMFDILQRIPVNFQSKYLLSKL